MQRAYFEADRGRNIMHQCFIERGRKPNRLWKVRRRHGAQRTVQRFGPPVIGRDAQARNGGRRVEQLFDFLVQRQPRDERSRLLFSMRPYRYLIGIDDRRKAAHRECEA